MNSVGHFLGIEIISTPMALHNKIEFRVEPWPIKKHRRGWRVSVYETLEPAIYAVDGKYFAHPSIVKLLKGQTKAVNDE